MTGLPGAQPGYLILNEILSTFLWALQLAMRMMAFTQLLLDVMNGCRVIFKRLDYNFNLS